MAFTWGNFLLQIYITCYWHVLLCVFCILLCKIPLFLFTLFMCPHTLLLAGYFFSSFTLHVVRTLLNVYYAVFKLHLAYTLRGSASAISYYIWLQHSIYYFWCFYHVCYTHLEDRLHLLLFYIACGFLHGESFSQCYYFRRGLHFAEF